MDLCGSLAIRAPWLGAGVSGGPCLWVAAEGTAGLGVRVAAWKAHQGVQGSIPLYFVPEAVSLPRDLHLVLELADRLPDRPVLTVIDNIARTILPGDENSATDMGLYVEAASRIREALGGTLMLIHHDNASGARERGSTALKAAVDTMLALEKDDDVLRLKCSKNRELPEFAAIPIRIVPVAGSAVALLASAIGALHSVQAVSPSQRDLLRALALCANGGAASDTRWKDAAGLAGRTYYHARKALEDKGLVRRDGKGWRLTDSGAWEAAVQ
jgi:hypothetical protein